MSKVQVTTSDNQTFQVDKEIALKSGFIKNLLNDLGEETPVHLESISGPTFAKVIEFMDHHKTDKPMTEIDEDAFKAWDYIDDKWDEEFFKIDKDTLFDYVHAANFLDIRLFLLYSVKFVSFLIKDMSTEEMRVLFGIENDWTPEEEKAIKEELDWCEKHLR